jgi:ATP-binding cassette, subfamily C (CFTR/MRP), member 1
MIRGGLVTNIFGKLMDVSVTAPDKTTTVTLMSADIERISAAFKYLHEFWANIIEVALAIWLLYRQLGPACAMPIAVAMGKLYSND